jgi:hypothetical protein
MPPAPLLEGELGSAGVVQQADGFFRFSQSQGTAIASYLGLLGNLVGAK